MASAAGKGYIIEPLNGSNFHNWKFRMELILAENRVKECVLKIIDKEKDEEVKKDNKAKCLIVQCVADSQIESLRNCETAYEMWEVLIEKYEKRGLPGQLFLKKKLLSMKLKEGESLERFIEEFEKIVRQLKDAGAVVQEEDLICNLLLGLPPSFSTVVTVLENFPGLTYEVAKSKIVAENDKRLVSKTQLSNTRSADAGVTAFSSAQVTCFKCGKTGHIRRECYSKDQYYSQVDDQSRGSFNRGRSFQGSRGFQRGRDFQGSRGFQKGREEFHRDRGQFRDNHENPRSQGNESSAMRAAYVLWEIHIKQVGKRQNKVGEIY